MTNITAMFIFSGFELLRYDFSAKQMECVPDVLETASYINETVAPIVDSARLLWDDEANKPALFECVVAEAVGIWLIGYIVDNSNFPSNEEILEKSKELADF